MFQPSLSYYLDRYAQGTLTPAEREELINLLRDPAQQEILNALLDEDWAFWEAFRPELPDSYAQVKAGVLAQVAPSPVLTQRPVHRSHFLRKWGWAAAIILLLGSVTYFYTTQQKEKPVVQTQPVPVENDVLPGSERATLTLADGRRIALDSASAGQLAEQGSASITKTADGEIRYDTKGAGSATVLMNTMSTPRGGQYKLTLPDGSKVWLNAASSITYPAVFTGAQRSVKVSGEVYLEVAKDKSKPFIVDYADNKVEVLGTSFNINAYAEENSSKVTLIDGAVKVNSAVLQPGQQARVGETTTVANAVNIQQVLAWKNGYFDFSGTEFSAFMREVERWYDVQVQYTGAVPTIVMKGEMDRGVKLSGIIRFLDDYGVKAKLQGRTLLIDAK